MILRKSYIDAITPFIDTPLVKILSGVRFCGKSTIFDILEDELKKRGINENNILHKSYTSMDLGTGYDYVQMHKDIKSSIKGKGRCYLLLDELQKIDGWEKVVNSLLESKELSVDIYVTGSNSKLMPSEISTYLSGRYVQIPVYTLSFTEYAMFKKGKNMPSKDLMTEYIKFGGFPIIAERDYSQENAYQIVDGIYSSIIRNDIAKRHKITNQELFDRVMRFIIDNVGKTFSANSITKFLKNEHRAISVETVYNYLLWLQEAFVIYKCNRYDLHGKAVLSTQEKYYLSDIAFRYALSTYDSKMMAAMLENIVFLELKRRGYTVNVGKYETKEIDFIAEKRGEKIYVQVCRNLPEDESGRNKEIGTLQKIKDHYHKYVVTYDELSIGNDNGIQIMHITDFLTKKDW